MLIRPLSLRLLAPALFSLLCCGMAFSQTPTLSSISPTAVTPGTEMTFVGSGFGAAQGQGTVYFGNGAYGSVVSWSDTQIVATVPGPIYPGSVDIYQNGVYSNQLAFTTVPATLTSISPTAVAPGMQVTFAGIGFGATQGRGAVYFGNGAYGTVVSWSDTQIVATVPGPGSGLGPGDVDILQNGVYSNQLAFTVVPPVLTSISPTALSPGMQVTFMGSGFGTSQGSGSVGFNNTAGTVVSWSDTQVVATVAAGTNPGNAWVTQNGVRSNYLAFTMVPPMLTSISPTALAPGMQVTFMGSGFGASQGTGSVGFNNTAGTVVSWSDTQVVATVAAGTNPGNAWVTQNGTRSNYLAFTMVPPTLSSISPTALSPGMQVTFMGSGFGTSQGSGSVGFNNTAGTVVSWSDTQVVATVAAGTNPGNAWVTQNGTRSNYLAFTVVPAPTITGLSPSSGAVGTVVSISGSSFGATQGNSTVSFNGSLATPTAWSDTSITVPVPSGASTGSVSVNVSGLDVSGPTFTVTVPSGLNTSRYLHSATLLNNGKVLLAGGINCPTAGTCTYLNSAELYDPATGAFTTTGSMSTARSAPAVLLPDGKVLIAGGSTCDSNGNCSSLSSGELYDPSSGTFSNAGNMNSARQEQTMALLQNGQVLIAGGEYCLGTSCSALDTAEIYDPSTNTFSDTRSLNFARFDAAAVVLNSGQVLVVGGSNGTSFPAAAELYDPATGAFTATGALNTPRSQVTATLLNNGKVLVVDGSTCGQPGCPTNSVELYDPSTATFSNTAATNTPRMAHTATLLTNGEVLVIGGYSACNSTCTADSTTELYDPSSGTFSPGESLSAARAGQSATLLANGNVLIAGGINAGMTLATQDVYQPSSLTPPNLVSIAVTPANAAIPVNSWQPMTATGTLSDGTTETLNSVLWSSSAPSTISISNAPGSAGISLAEASGSATVTASCGSISGSATVNAVTLVSLSVTPANPALILDASQQFTATGTYSDGSTQDLTTAVVWSSSDNSVVAFSQGLGSIFQGSSVAAGIGSATITASVAGVSASTTASVSNAVVPPVPAITSISPTSGAAGTQVIVTGSGFGASQGTGELWLGSTYGFVTSWSDSEIVATVNTGSVSGTAQVQQDGVWSNSINFTVNTPTISDVSPNSGITGTQVTITGAGFGATQGGGQVILGSLPAAIQSWSDGQIVALVTTGSMSGTAEVLQNGVYSNGMDFTINAPQISGITPNSGGPGTDVTINGSGFGASQGSGTVWVGSTYGSVMSWSDTQIVADVSNNSTNGTVRVQQNGTWSNAVAFGVPGSYTTTGVTLEPSEVSMVVGDARTLEAVDSNGNSLTGLSWTSSDTTVATLSTDDPPIITAIAPGHVTISAGDGSADLTVYAAPGLPEGTLEWSNAGDGSGVDNIIPAVPSKSGVADVFSFQGSGNVQAVSSDGTTVWTANVSTAQNVLPDFQGGLVVQNANSINKLDGMTGQPYPAYTYSTSAPAGSNGVYPTAVHTDGTIFTVDGEYLVGIDPTTGQPKFKIHMTESTSSTLYFGCEEREQVSGTSPPTIFNSLIIAGDGYAYLPYEYTVYSFVMQPDCSYVESNEVHLHLLRVGSDGSNSEIHIGDWSRIYACSSYASGSQTCSEKGNTLLPSISLGSYGSSTNALITNADTGTLLSWKASFPSYCNSDAICFPQSNEFHLTTTAGDEVSVDAKMSPLPSQTDPLQPILQKQDGTFAGLVNGTTMVGFNSEGQVLWTGADDYPYMATADDGVIGASGTVYDANGNATGQIPNLPVQSWPGYAYQYGSVDEVDSSIIPLAASFWAFEGANASGNNTAKKLPPPDASHNHTLTIREVPGANGIFGHITVQVDNNPEVGFAPKGSGPNNSLTATDKAEILANQKVPGIVEPRAANVNTLDAVTIYLTSDEASDAQQYITDRTNNPGYYQLVGNSCVDFGELVLIETTFPPPTDILPRSLPKSIRAEQIKENTVQAP